jgi:uncharacterized membrane protein
MAGRTVELDTVACGDRAGATFRSSGQGEEANADEFLCRGRRARPAGRDRIDAESSPRSPTVGETIGLLHPDNPRRRDHSPTRKEVDMSETPTMPPASGPEPPPTQAPKDAANDLDPKLGALLSYLLFGWIGGLIMFFTQKHPEVRFHAAQSILTFGGISILSALLSGFSGVFYGFAVWALLGLLSTLLGLAAFGLWILLCIKAYNLEHFKLPVVGDYAERWAAKE